MRRLFQQFVVGLFDASKVVLLIFSLLVTLTIISGSGRAFIYLLERFVHEDKVAKGLAILLGVGVGGFWHLKVMPLLMMQILPWVDRLQGAFAEWQGMLGPNPSAAWSADPGVRLVFDLGRHTFCDVHPGQALDKLAFLGRCDSPRHPGELRYKSRSVSVWHDEDRLDGVILFFQRDGKPCPGVEAAFRRAGRTLELTVHTTEPELLELLGPPTKRDSDGELIYAFPAESVEWRVNFGKNGGLETFEYWWTPAPVQEPAAPGELADASPGSL